MKESNVGRSSSQLGRCRWWLALCAIALLVNAASATAEPSADPKLPDLIGVDVATGDEISLSMLHGRVVVLSFWATWCKPCLMELDALEKMQMQIPKTELIVLAVNFGEQRMQVNRFYSKHQKTQLTMVYDRKQRAAEAFKVHSLPQMVLIDHTGAIRAHHKGYSPDGILELIDEINGLLEERDQALRPKPPAAAAASEPASGH